VSLTHLRRACHTLALVLGLAYVAYVLYMKFSGRTISGPLGDVGEFLLVLAAVTAFGIGLFVDEAQRERDGIPRDPG
jgi:hypothetical protein